MAVPDGGLFPNGPQYGSCTWNVYPSDLIIRDVSYFNWTYPGYTFSHWNTKPDNSGESFFVGNVFPSYAEMVAQYNSNFKVYAIWVPENITKYWVTDTQLQFLADAIRAEGNTSALLTYPNGFISAINNLSGTHTSSISANWPTDFNHIYWTTSEELESIAGAIRAKNNTSETLTYLEDFINSLTVVEGSSDKTYGTMNLSLIPDGSGYAASSADMAVNFTELYDDILSSSSQSFPLKLNFVGKGIYIADSIFLDDYEVITINIIIPDYGIISLYLHENFAQLDDTCQWWTTPTKQLIIYK